MKSLIVNSRNDSVYEQPNPRNIYDLVCSRRVIIQGEGIGFEYISKRAKTIINYSHETIKANGVLLPPGFRIEYADGEVIILNHSGNKYSNAWCHVILE